MKVEENEKTSFIFSRVSIFFFLLMSVFAGVVTNFFTVQDQIYFISSKNYEYGMFIYYLMYISFGFCEVSCALGLVFAIFSLMFQFLNSRSKNVPESRNIVKKCEPNSKECNSRENCDSCPGKDDPFFKSEFMLKKRP